MAADNTIALLSNICKKLDIISQTIVSLNTPETQRETVQKDIINNKVTGLTTVPEGKPQPEVKPIQPSVINNVIKTEADKGKESIKNNNIIDKNISIKDIVDFLRDLPVAVKAVSGLNGITIKRFENVLNKLSNSIFTFAEKIKDTELSNSDSKKIKHIVDSISTLGQSVKQIAKLVLVVPLFNLSLKMMIPGIKLLGKIFDILAEIKGDEELSEKLKTLNTALSGITKFIGGMIALTAATLLLGVLVTKSLPTLIAGLGAVLAVTIAYSGIAIGIAFLGSLVQGVEKMGALNEIIKFVALNMALTAATMLLGAVINQGWPLLAAGFAGVTAIMAGYTAIVFGLLALGTKLKVLDKSKSLFDITKFIAACIGIGFGTLLLGHFVKGHELEMLEGFTALTAIITAAMVFAKLADRFKISFKKGSAALAPLGIMMAGASAALLGIAGFLAIKKAADISWGETFAAIGAMATIVTAFGALAGVAGMFSAQIIAGAPALLATTKIALISEGLLLGVIALVGIKNKVDVPWGDIFATVGAMATIVTAFGALAGVAGLVSPVIIAGTGALALVSALAFANIGLLNNIIKLRLRLDETQMDDTKIANTINTMKLAIQGFVNMVRETSFGGLMGGINVMAKSAGLTILMTQVSHIAQSLGSIAAITTEDGKIRPAKFIDGKLVTGEPVDILASAKTISNTVREFTKLIGEDFKNISLKDMVHAMIAIKSINKILDPISNFITALMGFETSGDGTLHAVKITETGKIVNGPDVHLETVANIIAASISTFAKTLFSQDNAALWEQFKYGEDAYGNAARPSNIERGMGVLANVIDPVSKFVDCLSKFEGGDGSTLKMPIFDNEGKVKGSRSINVIQIADTIANAVTSFANQIATHAEEWEAAFNKGAYSERQMTKGAGLFKGAEYQYVNHDGELASAMGVFGKVISPVISFVECLSKFSVKGNSISIIDAKGVEHKTDLKLLATKISEVITNFITSITSLSTSESMKSTSEIVGNILKNTTNPVTDFVKSLIPYTDSKPGWLPILKADGTKERDVNILGASDNILNCVTAYTKSINTLASILDENQTKKIDTFTTSIGKTASAFSKLDEVLTKGNAKRIKSINDLSKAVEKLAEKVQDENIGKLSSLFSALSNINSENVAQVTAELSKINIGGGSDKTTYVNGGGTSKETIIAAIQEALDKVELTPETSNVTVTYATNNSNKITGITIPGIQISTGIDNY